MFDWERVGLIFFLGNTLELYLTAFVFFVFIFLVVQLFLVWIKKYLQELMLRSKGSFVAVLLSMVTSVPKYFLRAVSFYVSLKILLLHPVLEKIIDVMFISLVVLQLVRLMDTFLEYIVVQFFAPSRGKLDETNKNVIKLLVKILVWVIGVAVLMLNLGIEISPLLASLGIGGIAIAFALQNILADIFASFSILFDKPFKIGDFVTIGNESGTVKEISLKSTRIRSVNGQQLIIPNKKIVETSLNNYAGIQRRRIKLQLGVIYETPVALLRSIPTLCQDIVDSQENTEFLWAVFKDYGSSSLDFELVYNTTVSTYKEHLEIRQAINYALFERFEKEGLVFAYPTQQLYVQHTQKNEKTGM